MKSSKLFLLVAAVVIGLILTACGRSAGISTPPVTQQPTRTAVPSPTPLPKPIPTATPKLAPTGMIGVVVSSSKPTGIGCVAENGSFVLLVLITFERMQIPTQVEYTWRRVPGSKSQIEVLNRTNGLKFFLNLGETAKSDVTIDVEDPVLRPEGIIPPGVYFRKANLFSWDRLDEKGQACFSLAQN